MIFKGISRTFSTKDSKQYETIGAFWEEISAKYGIENLRGLGYNWMEDSIEYVIGLKDGIIEGADCEVELPDEGFTSVTGKTENLAKIYEDIYKDGVLTYEIESFDSEGNCRVEYFREESTEEYITFKSKTRDGKEIELAVIDEFEFERKYYVAAALIEDDAINEDSLFIYRLILKGKENYSVEKITDPKEYEKVGKAYLEMQ